MIQIVSNQLNPCRLPADHVRNSIDTLKIGFPLSAVKNLNLGRFDTRETTKGVDLFRHLPDQFGFARAMCVPEADSITVETSAKILGNDYRQGIHLGNLDQYANLISKSGLFEITPETLLDANVFRADACRTVELDYTPKQVSEALGVLNMQKGYHFRPYPAGQVISRKAKTKNDRVVCYGKLYELTMAKSRPFTQAHPKVLDTFTPFSFRVEHQLRKLVDLRTAFDVRETTLEDVLTSTENPVLSIVDAIAQDYNSVVSKIQAMSENVKMAERIAFVECHNRNLDAIMTTVKGLNSSKNLSGYKKKYRETIAYLETNQTKQSKNDVIIQHLKEKLA